jgi:hypothetical protein
MSCWKDTESMTIHYLVMLLSSNWFKFWHEIGLDVDDGTKEMIREECRKLVKTAIVGRLRGDEVEFEYVDYSNDCKQKVRLQLEEILIRRDIRGREIVKEWVDWKHDETSTAVMLRALHIEARQETLGTAQPPLSPEIQLRLAKLEPMEILDPDSLCKLAGGSKDSWDKYLLDLLEETPNALCNYLFPLLQKSQMKSLWRGVTKELDSGERRQLVAWYIEFARSIGITDDPIPSYLRGTEWDSSDK